MPEIGFGFERWHDFFLMSGTAAATMVGLLFVSVSFNIDVLIHDSRAHLLDRARTAFMAFLFALFISLYFLVPDANPRPFGMGLLVFGLIIVGVWGRQMLAKPRGSDPMFTRGHLIRRAAGPLLAGVMLAVSGFAIANREGIEGSAMLMVIWLLLLSGTNAAWDLLVRVAKIKRQSGDASD